MSTNFKIATYRTHDSLHMKLSGDFDGSSAFELINLLKDKTTGYYNVFINTSELGNIYPFGKEVIHRKLSEVVKKRPGIMFVGKNIGQLW
jgi:hypothetical protein